jgi:hypothetical protein
MTYPVSDGLLPTFDIIGLAFTTLGHFDSSNSIISNIIALIIIALPIWLTLWLFSTLQRINDRHKQLFIIYGLLAIVMLCNALYTQLWHWIDAGLFLISWLLINNFFLWIGAIILPTYFIYPEIREQNLRKVVAVCFILTGILRYGSEYLLSLTPASGLSYVSLEAGGIYPGYNLAMIPVTVGFAFVSYWIIHTLMQTVPSLGQWLSAK